MFGTHHRREGDDLGAEGLFPRSALGGHAFAALSAGAGARAGLAGRMPALIGLAAVCAVGAALGLMSAGLGSAAILAAVAVLLVGLAAVDLTLIPVLALSATLLQERLGGILSYSDVVLAAAAIVGLFLLRGRGALSLQPLIWAGLVYLVAIVPTLILNPFAADFIEWAHEVFLVIGSMIVGFVCAREGKAGAALGLFGLVCAAIGVWAGLEAILTGFQPVYLPGLHKNLIGDTLALSLVIGYARPQWLRWSPWFANLVVATSVIGVLASQSRQGIIGALVGLLIVTLRPQHGRPSRARRLIWLLVIPIVVIVWNQVAAQLASSNQDNSANLRLTWYADTIAIWRHSPIFGVGLRWWYTSTFGVNFQPPNAELEVLSCVGIVGLAAFIIMFIVACWLLFKLDPAYGTLGLAVVLARFTEAQFDLYWVAGQASILWIIAGACYGARERDLSFRKDITPLLALVPRFVRVSPR